MTTLPVAAGGRENRSGRSDWRPGRGTMVCWLTTPNRVGRNLQSPYEYR